MLIFDSTHLELGSSRLNRLTNQQIKGSHKCFYFFY